ncbi:MAG: hypothetical protein LBR71_06815 [Synergistaceae bacterium]|nr:hypothetical protein [Synergistaceae bacterium]
MGLKYIKNSGFDSSLFDNVFPETRLRRVQDRFLQIARELPVLSKCVIEGSEDWALSDGFRVCGNFRDPFFVPGNLLTLFIFGWEYRALAAVRFALSFFSPS